MSLYSLANELGQLLLQYQDYCAVAESCTGGSLAAVITDVPGSSQWFDLGVITYSNRSKEGLLGVSPSVISAEGAVSRAVAEAMARGVLERSVANVSVATTGIAGPDGGSEKKPVGTVWIAWACRSQWIDASRYIFQGSRIAIRQQAVQAALEGLIKRLGDSNGRKIYSANTRS